MKIVLLAPASSIHTQKWADGLVERGHEVVVATQHPATSWPGPDGPRVLVLPFRGQHGYFLNAPILRRQLRAHRPDILNVHYASGYGTTAALSGYTPSLLSVWGSDVFDFPRGSRLKARLLRFNLNAATRLASTSNVMARHTQSLLPGAAAPFVTPFGVETGRFAPSQHKAPSQGVVIGMVKALYPKYGVDVLIRAFAQVVEAADDQRDIRLLVVGDGPERAELEALAQQLGLSGVVEFRGALPHRDVPEILRSLDIFVASSRLDSESFGVAVVEASACGLPVVVTDVAGLSEVVEDGVTGYVVPRDDPGALALAVLSLVDDPRERDRMGSAGRATVEARYDWQRCLDTMVDAYQSTIDAAGRGHRASGEG
ncbi:O-antigen biosynthesis protein WlbH [Pedococcus ginsenosidimutans]|uniref:D-inositol 3-phosphate glycosyltransferase n=1 Tax=Pedococcus ginsenosidimutans TaxID=490570 RepID=A0ABP8Y0Y6_9MICO